MGHRNQEGATAGAWGEIKNQRIRRDQRFYKLREGFEDGGVLKKGKKTSFGQGEKGVVHVTGHVWGPAYTRNGKVSI